jgi:hypothetical protein
LYSIMALAARFSNLPELANIPRTQRGRKYTRHCGYIISNTLMDSDLDKPSLTFLHGCLLTAAYWLADRPNGKAWFLVGICVRAAYSLSLNMIDYDLRESSHTSIADQEWTRREELRRAWWCVVECDNFASVVRCRPLTIDRGRMHVLLPSEDRFWLLGKQTSSAFLDDDTLQSWRNLMASKNRNPHAWYLLVNQLMLRGHEHSLKTTISSQQHRDLRDMVQYAAMSLPNEFNLNNNILNFSDESAGDDNWIIASHIMLQR